MSRLMQVLDLFKDKIENISFKIKHRTKATYFTRNTAILNFKRLLAYFLSLPKGSAQIEVNRFLNQFNEESTVSKQALFEAREKISYKALVELNDITVDSVYSNECETWNGYRVLAVDGTVYDLPSSAMNEFGRFKTVSNDTAKAQSLAIVDVLNDLIIESDLEAYGFGETNMFGPMLSRLRKRDRQNDLFLFDRGFFSGKYVDLMTKAGVKFLFRVNSNNLKEINNANEYDQTVEISANGKHHRLRVLNVLLSSGVIEKLVTNIFESSFSPEEFKKLYFLRWGIETKYLELKERLQIENFSSGKKTLILQDFYAAIIISNLVSIACNDAKRQINTNDVNKKYRYKPNKNIAIATLRDKLIYTLFEEDKCIRNGIFLQIEQTISKYAIPIRTGRSAPRTVKYKSAKFPLNKKGF